MTMYGEILEPPAAPLDYMTEQRMWQHGWRKGMPPVDPQDGIGVRCQAVIEGKACVRRRGHLERPEPLPHLLVFAPSGQPHWIKEVWGAGAGSHA